MTPVTTNQATNQTQAVTGTKQANKAAAAPSGELLPDHTSGKVQNIIDQRTDTGGSIPVLSTPGLTPTQEQGSTTVNTLTQLAAEPKPGFGMPAPNEYYSILILYLSMIQKLRTNSVAMSNQSLKLFAEMAKNRLDTAKAAADEGFKGAWIGSLTQFGIGVAGLGVQMGAGYKQVKTEKLQIQLNQHSAMADQLHTEINTARTADQTVHANQEALNDAFGRYNAHVATVPPPVAGQPTHAADHHRTYQANDRDNADITGHFEAVRAGYHHDRPAVQGAYAEQANKWKMSDIGAQTFFRDVGRIGGDTSKGVREKSQAQKNAEAAMLNNLTELFNTISQTQKNVGNDNNSETQKIIDAINAYYNTMNGTNRTIISKI